MNDVAIGSDNRSARISGGARASDVAAVTDPLRVAAVAGSQVVLLTKEIERLLRLGGK